MSRVWIGAVAAGALAVLAASAAAQPTKTDSERGNVHQVPVDHQPTERAAAEARRTLPIFIAKWRAKPAGYSGFRLKARFPTDDGRGDENLWIEPLSIAADGAVTGRLSNDSVAIPRLKMGMQVRAPAAKVVDWMYVKDRKMFGHFTTRAQLDLAPPEQRAQLLALLAPSPLEPGDH